jgi:hypothetical protein
MKSTCCTGCGGPHTPENSYVRQTGTRAGEYHSKCRECASEAYKTAGRDSHYRTKYGLTKQEVDWMLVEQGGQCAICLKDISEKRCLDHNHATGKPRRLLCYQCNHCISALEIPGWKEKAENYVRDNS